MSDETKMEGAPEGTPPGEENHGQGEQRPDVRHDPSTPERYRLSRVHLVADAMGIEFSSLMGEWLWHNRDRLQRSLVGPTGRLDAKVRLGWSMRDVEHVCPHTRALRSRLLGEVDKACEAVGVEPFKPSAVEMQASLYHHEGFYTWHTDRGTAGGTTDERKLSWVYYLHSLPKMFTGGELEFLDGQIVEPISDTLVFFPPEQRHRVTRVECYVASAMYARWSFCGWVH